MLYKQSIPTRDNVRLGAEDLGGKRPGGKRPGDKRPRGKRPRGKIIVTMQFGIPLLLPQSETWVWGL